MPAKGIWIEQVDKRTRSSKTRVDSADPRHFAVDVAIGSVHYKDAQDAWQNIDNEFVPISLPWNWEMVKAGYHIRVKEDFTAGQIIQFEKQGEAVEFQPMALEWTCDTGAIEQISMPQDVTPVITNPEVDLLPAVGVPSHRGTIRWNGSYGSGIDFEWKCTSSRLVKKLVIDSLSDLPTLEQYIIDGGNPVLRFNLIFDPSKDLDIFVDGQEWDKKKKAQTFKAIEFRKDGEVLWGFMPLKYWGSDSGVEGNDGQSVATLEKRGAKLYISIRVPYSWLQLATFPVFIDADVNEQVSADLDDAVEESDGDCVTDGMYITMGNYYAGFHSGQRFASVTIQNGSTIGTAYLTWRSQFNDNGAFAGFLYGEDGANPPQFNTDAYDITSWRLRTVGVTCGSAELGDWSSGSDYDSPEIKTIIQELVGKYDYSSSAPMVILFIYDSGTGERIGTSHDSDPDLAPKLHIEYSVAAVAPPRHGFVNFQVPGIV